MRLIDGDKLIEEIKEWGFIGETCATEAVNDAPTIKTKEVKYYDEDERVWKIGRVIVDE